MTVSIAAIITQPTRLTQVSTDYADNLRNPRNLWTDLFDYIGS